MRRNVKYGLGTDYTEQDVIALNGTLEHTFAPNLNLRNQTEFI